MITGFFSPDVNFTNGSGISWMEADCILSVEQIMLEVSDLA